MAVFRDWGQRASKCSGELKTLHVITWASLPVGFILRPVPLPDVRMSSITLAFSTEVGKGLVERFNMGEWLSFAITLRSHGMSGKAFSFCGSEALVNAPELASRLT